MAVGGFGGVGEVDGEVVGEVDGGPGVVVEFWGVGALVVDGGCFGEVVEVFCACAVVEGGVGVAEGESPALVEGGALLAAEGLDGEEN